MKLVTLLICLVFFSPKISAQNNNNNSAPPPPPRKIYNDPIFQVVEEEPYFIGGFQAFQQYLINNIKYPKKCKKNKIQGKVYIQLLIEKDGTVSEIKQISSPHPDLFDEAARVLMNTKWNPAKVNREPVRYRYTVPIVFSIEKPKK